MEYECAYIRKYISETQPRDRATSRASIAGVDVEVTAVAYAEGDRPARVCAFALDAVRVIASLPFARPLARRIQIRLWLTPFKKTWCIADTTNIGPCNVNSGVTSFGTTITIDIYREEDRFKLLLHEIGHAFGIHNLVRGVADGEAVVEATAALLYLLMLSRDDADARAMLDVERAWMRRQVAHLRAHRWTSSTHTRAYYITKYGLLSDVGLPLFVGFLFDGAPAWPRVRAAALGAARAVPAGAAPERCVSMRMVAHDLVLA